MEDSVKAKILSSDRLAKKPKKALKRKVTFDDVACANGSEAVPHVPEITEVQSVPSLRPKKRKKKHGYMNDESEQNVQQDHSTRKKKVKSDPESGTVSLEQRSTDGQCKGDVVEEGRGSNRGDTSWVQRASWTSLVGETGRVAFSLGSVVGNVDFPVGSMEQLSTDVHSSNDVSAWIDGTGSSPLLKAPHQSSNHLEPAHIGKIKSSSLKKFQSPDGFGCLGSEDAQEGGLRGSAECDKTERPEPGLVSHNVHENGVDKCCTFMRSENYEQEWLEAKRAVKDIFKRTRKDALRSMKMFHPRHTT